MALRRSPLLAIAAAALLAHPAGAAAAPDTTIGFEGLAGGQGVTNQYVAKGVSFGSGKFGMTGPDCADPTAHTSGAPAGHSGPSYAALGDCIGGQRGVNGGFDHTRSRVSFFIRDTDDDVVSVTLRGYDTAKNEIVHQTVAADSTWQQLSIAQPAGTVPRIRYFSVVSDIPTTSAIAVDDMTFDNPTPFARFVSRTPHPLPNQVVALDGSPSHGPGGIDRYAWDFNGDGKFDAVCPGALPVAYKEFGKPAAYEVVLKIDDSGHHQAISHASVVVGKPTTPHKVAGSDDLTHFWCGARASASHTDLGFLPQGFTSDVHAVGIDVTQGTVPTDFGPGGRFGAEFRTAHVIAAGNYDEDPATYSVNYLQQLGKTVVRVYASALHAPNGTNVPNVQMRLYGVDSHGNPLPGGPLLSQTGPLNVPVGPPFTTHAMRVGLDSRGRSVPTFTFTLPDDWTHGDIGLIAKPVLVGARLDRQCGTAACVQAQQKGLGGVRFFQTGLVVIRSVAMTFTGSATLPDPSKAFDAITNVSPIALLPSPYQGTRDLTTLRKNCIQPDGTFCKDVNDRVKADIDMWAASNKPQIGPQAKVITVGVHTGFRAAQGSSTFPGGCPDNASGGAICETTDNSPISHVELLRPLTSVGHEVLHDLGRQHAGPDCGGNGPPWPPDQRGDLHGIGLDRHTRTSRSLKDPYRLISGDRPGQPNEEYDLMSYCYGQDDGGTNCFEKCAWISPENWDELSREWVDFLGKPKLFRGVFVAAKQPGLDLSAYADPSGVHIAHLGTTSARSSHPATSSFHAVVRDGSGHVISNTPLFATFGHSDNQTGGPSTPYVTLSGVVPSSAAAQKLDLTQNGAVVRSVTRSAHAPKVTLLSPHHGRIGRRPKLKVRWRASDLDGGLLTAFIDYSTDGGGHWRNVFSGGNTGTAKLPRDYFSFSRDARIRIRVNDGFNERVAVSGKLISRGSPPTVRIKSPRNGLRVTDEASVYLAGQAFDDTFAPLTGRSLRWYVGDRLVGKGIAATASHIPPGKVRIRLVARDRRGRKGSASVRIRSVAERPFFVVLDAPRRLSAQKTKLKLKVATDQSATLTVGKRSHHVGPRTRTITVHVPRGHSPLKLKLKLSAHGKTATETLRVRRPS